MKIVQYLNEQGSNTYIPSNLIIRISDEGSSKSRIQLAMPANEQVLVNMRPLELIEKLYGNDQYAIIITDDGQDRADKKVSSEQMIERLRSAMRME